VSEQKYHALEKVLKEKVDKTYALVEASLDGLELFELERMYTPKELEPYDALADRFIRCVEVFIKYFKAYEYHNFSDKSPTLRDGMNVMEKVGLISNTPLWMDMRDVRNRIVHDYLPEQTKDMFDSIMGEFFNELTFSKKQIGAL
jgi:uncharacterized protein with HEPN domain